MYNKYLYIFVLLCITGCKKFLKISPPNTQVVTESTFDNDNSATAAVTYIYTQMMSNGDSYNLSFDNGLLSDELSVLSTSNMGFPFYTNSLIASENPGEWNEAYSCIFQANAAIEA